jgi:hypothetical protein
MLGYLLQAQAEGAGVGAGVGVGTDSAMSWSKQHTTARRCGDHNEHSLQHHNAHCTAEALGAAEVARHTTRSGAVHNHQSQ